MAAGGVVMPSLGTAFGATFGFPEGGLGRVLGGVLAA